MDLRHVLAAFHTFLYYFLEKRREKRMTIMNLAFGKPKVLWNIDIMESTIECKNLETGKRRIYIPLLILTLYSKPTTQLKCNLFSKPLK